MLIKDISIAKNLFLKYKELIYGFGAFIAYMLLQSIFLDYHYYTFKSSFETILYIISFFAALYVFDDKQKIKRLIFVSLAAVFIVSFDAIYQYFAGKDISIKELAETIKRVIGFQGELYFNTEKLDGTMVKLTNPSKLYELGWRHKVELEDGIRTMHEWCLKNR